MLDYDRQVHNNIRIHCDRVLIMYIFTTLEFPTHKFDFHPLTTSVNAKYYY